MIRFLAFLFLATFASAQITTVGGSGLTTVGGSGLTTVGQAAPPAGPTYVNSSQAATGATAITTSFSPTNGNSLVVFVDSATVVAFTIADGEGTGNTYTQIASIDSTGSGSRGRMFLASNVTGTGTYTITVTGATTTYISVMEISGNRSLAGVSVGTNPSTAFGSTSPMTPASFTTTDANCILVDTFGDLTGNTITIGQVDGTYTTDQSSNNGATSFVGAMGHKVVSATGSYSDGWTSTAPTEWVSIHAAFK